MVMQIRRPSPAEMDAVYLMGFDAWGNGDTRKEFLAACRHLPHYRSGTWHVLEKNGVLMSSLLLHRFPLAASIDAVATVPDHRGEGYASTLVETIVDEVEAEGVTRVFLFAQGHSSLYRRMRFEELPKKFQVRKDAVCLLRAPAVSSLIKSPHFHLPAHFQD